jgi:hypothetical protein
MHHQFDHLKMIISARILYLCVLNGFKPTPRRHMTCACDCIYSFNVLLMMGAENTRNM